MSDPDIRPRTTDDLEYSPHPTATLRPRRPTAAQRRFVEHYLTGGPEGPPACASAAYRYAVGHDGRDNGTSANAAKMLRSRGVQDELHRLRAEQGTEPVIDVAQHVARLQRVYDAAMTAGNYAAACRAEVSIGQVMGFYTARRLNVHVEADKTVNAMARLRYLMGQYPDLKVMLANLLTPAAGESDVIDPTPQRVFPDPGGEPPK